MLHSIAQTLLHTLLHTPPPLHPSEKKTSFQNCNLIPRALMGRSPELFMHYYHLKVRLERQWPLQIKVLRVHYPAGCISKPQRNRAQICTPNITSLRWVPRRRSRMCENGILTVDNGQWIKEYKFTINFVTKSKRQWTTKQGGYNRNVAAFPDAVHGSKNDRASFGNWYRFVDGNCVNLVLLRTARVDPNLKHLVMPHLSLAACRNRDRMDVDTVIEICSPPQKFNRA